jgi:hypothetical protein
LLLLPCIRPARLVDSSLARRRIRALKAATPSEDGPDRTKFPAEL